MSTPIPSIPTPYLYNATVLYVHDGDTIDVEVDFGRHRYDRPRPIRLLGCNAIELREPGGQEAQANLAQLLPVGAAVVLATTDDDKFAPRWDAEVFYTAPTGFVHDLVADLVAEGWVALWNGDGPRPVPPWPRVAPASNPAQHDFALREHQRAVREWKGLPA